MGSLEPNIAQEGAKLRRGLLDRLKAEAFVRIEVKDQPRRPSRHLDARAPAVKFNGAHLNTVRSPSTFQRRDKARWSRPFRESHMSYAVAKTAGVVLLK
jgi:hypothetical protein